EAAPVKHRVERPPDLLVEPYVEQLEEGDQDEQDSGDGGRDASRPGREHQRYSYQDQPLSGDAGKGGWGDQPPPLGRHPAATPPRSRTSAPVMASRRARRVRAPAPVRYSQITSRPNDSVSSSNAAVTAIVPARRSSSPDAATVSTMPWTAATTLRQYRGGSGAASHGITQPASSSA